MTAKNLTYKISDDESTVTTLNNAYLFRRSNKGCYRCEIRDLCYQISAEDGEAEFPFPCLSDNRKDKRNGCFQSIDTISRRSNIISLIISLIIILLAVFVFYNIIPNYLGEMLCSKE